MVSRPQEVPTDSEEILHDTVNRREPLELSGRRAPSTHEELADIPDFGPWRRDQSPAAWPPWRVLVFGGVGPPRRRGCHDRGPVRIYGPCVSRGAQAGGVLATAAPGHAPVRRGRAPLRGAASHEAEGRRGARGGGAGRVGPLVGWHRLRLLRQIGDELVSGVEQFLLINNVVTVEDGAALVPGQEHGDPLGDVRADQVAGGGAPAIVEEAGWHPGRLAGGAPRRAPAADGDAVAVEHGL